ncbi:MAG: NAD-dependent epimerase/dehydratase family protein [Rhodobacteraceae bacterium]|nr:MAG: NAD-dependent epimerase/dehydratase family protein [Paracoccaceae bacterium]
MSTVVLGCGTVGRSVTEQLAALGEPVRVIQRSPPDSLPEGVEFAPADAVGGTGLAEAMGAAHTLVCTVGLPYSGKVFRRDWPRLARNCLDACARTGARFLLADNLYMYGPQTTPLTEDMPLARDGDKPSARAEVTRLWQEAHAAGQVMSCAVRASDFYGPGAQSSMLVAQGINRLLAGKPARMAFPVDHAHDYTYVPDFACAIIQLLDAPEGDWGQAWHVPNAPTRTTRELLAKAAEIAGVPLRVTVMPDMLRRLLGVFIPILSELEEMRFQWDLPYQVDSSKFLQRFGGTATPFEEGLATVIAVHRHSAS